MWDFSMYNIQNLFRIKEALEMLAEFSLEDSDMLFAVNMELQEREKKGGE